MPPAPLHSLTATELARGYRAGKFTPVDVLDDVFDRLDAVNSAINAIVADARETARAAASSSAGRWAAGSPLGGLDGIPISIKDNLHARGLAATWGSVAHQRDVATEDELPIERLRNAGAVVFAKTNVPEFTLQGYTGNAVFGTTRNPLARDLTPGGSTGGGAAAVAAGIGAIAIGTDGGGSLRRPAAHCGLFGIKPSLGQIARGGGFPQILADFEVVGPIARSLDDLALTFSIMQGYDPRDPRSLAANAPLRPFPSQPRIGYFPRVGSMPVDPRIASAVGRFADALSRAGATVEEIAAPYDPEPMHAAWAQVAAGGLAWYAQRLPSLDGLGSNALAAIETGRSLSAADYAEAYDDCLRVRAEAVVPFARYDMLLAPTTAALAWPAALAYPTTIDGREVGPRGHSIFTVWANVAGLAAVSLPIERTLDQGGIGAQLIAAPGRDKALLDFCTSHPLLRELAVARPTMDLLR